jgi:sulfofructose kinase
MPGGQAATAAVACARQGWRARYIGCLGEDPWGDTIVANLTREGVSVAATRRAGARSRTATIIVERASGRRTIVEQRDVRQRLTAADVEPAAIADGRVLLVDATDVEASTLAARVARAAGIPTVVDVDRPGPEVNALLSEIDVLIVPLSFAGEVAGTLEPGTAVAKLDRLFRPALTVITMGSEGSLALCEGQETRTSVPVVPVVDTTGAGDAFRGGFIAAWLQFGPQADVSLLLRHANAVAAQNCQAQGAQTGLSDRAGVAAFVTGAWGGQSK